MGILQVLNSDPSNTAPGHAAFFGGIVSGLFGGQQSQGSGQSQSTSGFALLPPSIQQAFESLGTNASDMLLNNPTQAGANYFTPMGLTPTENQALSSMTQGFAPTAQSLSNSINMQMDPYESSVINQINNQANGQYSILKQAEDQDGALGSNRDELGANDIDLTRQNQIGSFLSNEYNTSLNNALTTIPGLEQQDASNQMNIGTMLRNLQLQTEQAPLTAQQYAATLMGVLPQNGGSQSTMSNQNTSSNNNGLFSGIGGILAGL